MGSQSVEIIRQGIWASLTGGWYYDPHQNVFCNTFHLYLWLYLLCVPFCVYLYASWWWIGWVSHLIILALVAFTIKGCNYLLHHMFDTGECLQEEIGPDTPTLDAFRPSLSSQNASSIGHQRASSFEALEMQVVSNRGVENATPPVGCSSRNSIISSNNLASSITQTAPAVIDLKVDVHHKDSSGSEEGGLKPQDGEVKSNCQSDGTLLGVDEKQPEFKTEHTCITENSLDATACEDAERKSGCKTKSRETKANHYHDSRSSFQKSPALKETTQPTRHRKKPKHDLKATSLTRTSDLEGCLASSAYKNEFPEDRVLPPTEERVLPPASHPPSIIKSSSVSRSCRATPDPLFQSRNLSITKGERSCSAPNCSIEVAEGTSGRGLIHRLSFCQGQPCQEVGSFSKAVSRERERKGKKTREDKRTEGCGSHSPRTKGKEEGKVRVREKDKTKISDIDSEEDPSAKDSSSPLLVHSQATEPTHRKGQRAASSRPYHPLVCRRTTSLAKDDLKVTTLTFENVYADEENERNVINKSSSSSSDEALESPPVTSRECNDREVSGPVPSPLPSTSRIEEGKEEKSAQPLTISMQRKCEDNSSTSSSSSCPDIEWLFCHSESDSEFSNVAKTILTQRLKKGCSHSQKGEDEDDDEDSWTAIRSSPEADDLPSEGSERKLNMRDPEGTSKQGAIPKQRRQGLVVRDGEITADGVLPPEGEAAGVTMDLVRKMLDVFSNYPDNRPRDIKKLLVLVSLEQDNRRAHSSSTGTDESVDIQENSSNSASRNLDTSKEPSVKEEDARDEQQEDETPRERKTQEVTKTTVLHRKPAVRRRRNQFDSFESTSPVEKTSEGKSHKEYQTTLSGAVSYFGNSDEETCHEIGNRKLYRKTSTMRKFSPESLLPLSAFEGLPAPAIHLATCHDDTTNGAVHCFQDERGHWFTYTFNNTIAACTATSSTTPSVFPQIRDGGQNTTATTRGPTLAPEDTSLSSSSMSLCSGLTVVLDSQAPSSPLSGPPWSESGKATRDSRPPTRTSPSVPPSLRRLSPPNVGPLASHREGERTGRGGILGEVMERGRNPPNRSSTSGPGVLNNPPRNPVPRDLLSSGPPHLHLLNLGTPGNPLQLFTSAIFDRRRIPHRMNSAETDPYYDANLDVVDMSLVKQLKFSTPAPQTTQYYKLKLYGKKTIKVRFDRLSLLALLDRNLTLTECLATAFLVALVGILGCLVLRRGFYQEFKAFIFCVVMAASQYSLFKSVQPDAASPTHGYNRIVLYSRPVYFCICCSLVLALDFYLENSPEGLTPFILYGMELTSPVLLLHLRDFLLFFLLLFPLFFSLGLLPQVNTFLTYFLEQIDMHVFGGNATTGLSSAFYCVLRSALAVLFLTGFAYGGLREEDGSQHILYSIFCALTVAFAYHLSRSGANPSVLWQLIQKHLLPEEIRGTSAPKEEPPEEDPVDPLPKKLRSTVTNRLLHDSIVCTALLLIVFALHSSTVFDVLLRGHQGPFPDLLIGLGITACFLGFLNHYLIPQLRTQQPWMCIARPACMTHEYSQFEAYDAAKVMWFEKLYVWLCLLERNILYPIIFLCSLTRDAEPIMQKHPTAGTVMIVVCGLKCLRSMYSQTQFQYLVLAFTVLFFNWDSKGISESFLVDYFFMSIVFSKAYEFLLKLKFIVTYIAPWQITWGSAFHAFAQPFSVPHSAMLFVQAAISAVLSTPLNPILGSAIFITSYVRPVKFWERDYNTKRIDHSNTRLSSLLEQNPGADDNNLNSIFYEHLTRSLQHSLCGDLIMGRWGTAAQGDCFVLASDNLNCLVHIIELGNGLVTFQVRGLEFRGTYCQQREVEAISEGVEEDRGCCCCEPGHLPHMLSPNAAFNQRWLAWEVTATKYILEGYSISDNSATSMFQMFELRKILITYYVKSIIFFVIQSQKLEEWLSNEDISRSLAPLREKKFADLDPTFHAKIDDDYDPKESGITRNSFCNVYFEWIAFCVLKRKEKPKNLSVSKDSLLVSLCLALSLLGRRALGPSSQCDNVDVFLQFLHSLFKGDIRPTCVRDEWVFGDMELLRKVVAPALRISLKLHQDHFLLPDEYDNHEALYSALLEHQATLVICHEGDPQWRAAVLSGRPSLLSLRHVNDDGEDKFKVIMLNKRHLLFRVIKVNRECVRGLWAGQQQELVYLRNRNPERGSIQNAKQALRNIINSSCDQPIGYPIYVSPLTTSYADTHEQLSGLCGTAITPKLIKETAIRLCNRLRERCVEGCSSGSSGLNDECSSRVQNIPESFQNNSQLHQVLSGVPLGPHLSQDGSPIGSLGLMSGSGGMPLGGSLSGGSLSGGSLQANRGSLMSTVSSLMGGPQNKQSSSTLASLAGLLTEGGASTLRQGFEGEGGRDYSHREKSSIHNSRDSLTYNNIQREGHPQWDAVGTIDFRDKRGQGGGSRGSSMSGITFLSREGVPVGAPMAPPPPPPPPSVADAEWEWEMGPPPPEVALRATGSVHSLQSSSSIPRQGGTPPPPPPPPSGCYSSTGVPHNHDNISAYPPSLHDIQQTRSYHHHKTHLQHHQRHPSATWSHDGTGGGGGPVIVPEKRRKHHSPHRVRIMDANQVYDTLNLGRRIDVIWPDEWMRSRGGRNFWGNWVPVEGMEGTVIHTWKPHHPDPKLRSHVERTIYLVQIQDKYVPVAKNAVRDITVEEDS